MSGDPDYIYNLFNLKNQAIILTGGMGMLGTNYAGTLLKAGGRVAVFDIVDKPDGKLKQLARKYPLAFYKVDITDEKKVEQAVSRVEKTWDTPTILINNAGWIASPHTKTKASVPFEEYPVEVWEEVFKTNTTSAVICSKIVGKKMIAAKRAGVIINIASTYALVAPDQRIYEYKLKKEGKKFVKDASYGASKAALLSLTRDLAVCWAPHNIRVVALSPGGVIRPTADPDFVRAYSKRTPLGRMANPDDYNAAILFLASDASRYMTGSNLIIDGGWTAW